MTSSFTSEEMAAGYARDRPPVHARVFELLEARRGTLRAERALDVGCGAGLSTRVLQPRASQTIGIDPAPSMLHWAKKLVADAAFVAGTAEAIPLGSGTAQLVTAAGSLNYAEWKAFFRETARVLTSEGRLLIYDFEPGRSFRDMPDLDRWFEEFSLRFPWPDGDGQEVDPEMLGTASEQFGLDLRERFRIAIAMTREAYVDYMMTETNVATAVRHGVPPQEIRDWCREGLKWIWNDGPREIVFNGYFAQLRRERK
ncbi:MAG: class I SAM-dependent methyltransferase [Bryobacteraceae bacterium]